MPAAPLKYRLIAGLLNELEREGYPMAPDKLLQVQELLRRLPPDTPPERLRSLLAPLFVTEPRQQQRFYDLFDLCLADARAVFATEEAAEPNERFTDQRIAEQGETRWRRFLLLFPPLLALLAGLAWDAGLEKWYAYPAFWLAMAILLGSAWAAWKLLETWPQRLGFVLITVVMGGAGYWLKTMLEPVVMEPISYQIFSGAIPDSTIYQSLRRANDTASLLYADPQEIVETPIRGRFRVDSAGIGAYTAAGVEAGQVDTLTALLTYARGTDTVYWIATIIEPEDSLPPPPLDTLPILSIPYPHDIAELKIDAAADQRFRWARDYEWPLKGLLLLLLAALAWAIIRWDRYRRARVVAELQRPGRAPYVWRPDTGQDAAALLAPGLQLLLTRLRGRTPDERMQLDVPASIRATSRRAGRVKFVYRRRSLPPDYLLLIDRLAANDHRAHLFDSLYRVFLHAEAPVARYFYDGDPRLLFDEDHPQGVALAELLHRHAGAQLIMVGEGQGLLSPTTGRPAPWTSLLAAWPRRVLLSPRPLRAWGPREGQLKELLPLLPASPGGLNAALDLFAAEDPTDTGSLLRKVKDALHRPFAFGHDLLTDLRRHFEPPLIDWIAACALWPALHWDLTLHLGRSLSERHGQELIAFEHLRELTRLPWFAEGRIPEAVRAILLDYLGERGLEEPLRQSLRQLLQQAPAPPVDSAAYDDYRMNLILNELFLKPDAATRRRLEREFAAYLAAGKKADFVALRLLDREPTRLDVLLGGALKKYAFREGLPGLGWRLAPKMLGIWAVLAAALYFLPLAPDPCAGERVAYQDMPLCLDSDSARLLYLEYLAGDAILEQDSQRVDSLRTAADAIRLKDTAFYRNTATRYYNYAARAWNCTLPTGQPCNTLPADSLRAIACDNFRRGGALSEALTGRQSIQYYLAIQKVCPLAQPPPALFSLSGRVVDAATGRPIAGATVRVGDANRTTFAQLAAGRGSSFFPATTDAQGRYTLDSLPAMEQLQLYAAATPDYEPYELRSPPRDELPPIRLSLTDDAREAAAWAKAVAEDTPKAYSEYLAAFPNGPNATAARQKLDEAASAQEQNAWTAAQRTNTVPAYEAFLRDYPGSSYAPEARRRINDLKDEQAWGQAQAAGTPEACRQYLEGFPQGKYVEQARQCAAVLPDPVQKLINDMVRVPGGPFTMGCQDEKRDGDCYDSEKPLRQVQIPDFSIGKYEVTVGEYLAFADETKSNYPEWLEPGNQYHVETGSNSYYKDKGYSRQAINLPIVGVSWNNAVAYCNWLSQKTGQRFRLPTEAEWEYAARGGQRGKQNNYLYSGSNDIDEVAWYSSNSGNKPRQVGQKKANELGLYDMSGNVWEWCEDVWHENYEGAPTDGSAWLSGGDSSRRVLRGGSWYFDTRNARLSNRFWYITVSRFNYIGFRLARD